MKVIFALSKNLSKKTKKIQEAKDWKSWAI